MTVAYTVCLFQHLFIHLFQHLFFDQVTNGNILILLNIGPIPKILQFKFKLYKNSKIKIKFCCKSPQQVQHVLVTYRNNIKVPYILAKLN